VFLSRRGGNAFPRSNARCFADLSRETTWLSLAVENGSVEILKESAIVKAWNAARNFGNGCFGVCIEAHVASPCGGCDRRNTENQLASFPTPHLEAFLDKMRKFIKEENNTPLRQRYVGLVAFRYFVALTTGRPFDMPIGELTESCMASGKVRIGEGFPSDTYKRSNGSVVVLRPASRGLLLRLSQAKWAGLGNYPARMSSLFAHQQCLTADLQRADLQEVPAMRKIPNAWGDLWDAFTCAFVLMLRAAATSFAPTRALSPRRGNSSIGLLLTLSVDWRGWYILWCAASHQSAAQPHKPQYGTDRAP
jgi:hypothetical protein